MISLFVRHASNLGALTRRSSVLSAFLLTALLLFPAAVFGQSLDEPFGPQKGIGGLANAIFRFGIILIVLAAAIFIAIGAYMYFIASGNAESAKTGKEYISRAIIGLVLGLLAWVILNTISPQFASELK